TFASEPTGGPAGSGVPIDYVVSGALGSNTMRAQCVAEGPTTTVCPNNPTVLTACPLGFPSGCLAVESILPNQIYTLAGSHRVEVGGGHAVQNADTCSDLVAGQLSESLLACAVHQNESLDQDSGCVHVEVLGAPPTLDFSNCHFATTTFGKVGTELGPPHQIT